MMGTGVDHNQAYPDRALQCFCLALVGQWLPPPCCPSAVEGAVAARRRQPVLTVAAWQLALACTAALASWGRGLSGGATAALAAGMSAAAIRAAGRWSSDIYQIYCRLSRESAAGVATVIGSTSFEDLERGVQFVDEELMLTAAEMPSGGVSSFVEQDLIDDAWGVEDDD